MEEDQTNETTTQSNEQVTEEFVPVTVGPRWWACVFVLGLVALGSHVSQIILDYGGVGNVAGTFLSLFLLFFLLQWVKVCGTGLDCIRKAHFDELNIVRTYKPIDKQYGHMKITEPDTPWESPMQPTDQASASLNQAYLNALIMTEKTSGVSFPSAPIRLKFSEPQPQAIVPLTDFEKKRNMHYDEGHMIKVAKELLKQDGLNDSQTEDEDKEDKEDKGDENNNDEKQD